MPGEVFEQYHRARPPFYQENLESHDGIQDFHSAQATIDGIETAHMIRKGQLSDENIPVYGFSRITVPADKCGFALYEKFATEPS